MSNESSDHESPERSNKRRVTTRDIGKALGVSHVTVSRSLRDEPGISDATKERVKRKAEEMGYTPDPMLSALSNYRLANQESPVQASLAWINLFEHPEDLRKHHVFDLYWTGARDTARNFGYHLEEFRLTDYPIHRMDSILKARGIRGILLTPSSFTEAELRTRLEGFPWKDYATVRFGQSAEFLKVNFVSSSQVANTILAIEQIRKRGYKRIGYIGKYFRKFLFSAGFLWAQQALPEGQRIAPLVYDEKDPFPKIQNMLKEWLEKTKPDAVLGDTPDLLKMLQNLGYRIPDDIALCALSTNDTPVKTGIDQNPEEIGRVAVRSLVSQLHENRLGIPEIQSEILVEGHWTDGPMLPDMC